MVIRILLPKKLLIFNSTVLYFNSVEYHSSLEVKSCAINREIGKKGEKKKNHDASLSF